MVFLIVFVGKSTIILSIIIAGILTYTFMDSSGNLINSEINL
jgi:hypothetical protein